MLTSDYSRANGVLMSTSSGCYGNGYWCLRSPYDTDSDNVRDINFDVSFCSDYCVNFTAYSIVTALQIQL